MDDTLLEKEYEMLERNEKLEERDDNKDKEGGIVQTLVSDLVNGRKIENLEAERENDDKEEEKTGEGSGILNNFISKFVHQNHEGGEHNTSDTKGEKGENGARSEEHESGAGAKIIDTIVSHLPASFTDEVDPPTDEASILIHSIVHD